MARLTITNTENGKNKVIEGASADDFMALVTSGLTTSAFESGRERVGQFLAAMDENGLPVESVQCELQDVYPAGHKKEGQESHRLTVDGPALLVMAESENIYEIADIRQRGIRWSVKPQRGRQPSESNVEDVASVAAELV